MNAPKSVRICIAVLLCLGLAPLWAGGEAEKGPGRSPGGQPPGIEAAVYPMEVQDDGANTVVIPARPQRIISLTAFTDDVLLEVVDPAQLLGVTAFSTDPAISNVAQKAAAAPNKLTLNVEVLISLRPDLVFVADWSEADKVQQLRDAGIPAFLVATAVTVPGIEGKITMVSRLVGEEERGRALVAGMEEKLADLRRRLASIPEAGRLSVLDYAVWGSAQGKGSSWDEIVRLAGLLNAVAGLEADQYGQVPLSKEKLLELDPDILILPGWVYGDPQGAKAFFDQTLGDPALQGLKAIQQRSVYQMPEGLKTTTSQYIVSAAWWLSSTAYPQLFR
jgi:iron complex transport system substrate-binding protein